MTLDFENQAAEWVPRIFNSTPVRYDPEYNCITNCAAITTYAAALSDEVWCLWDCKGDAEQIRRIVREAVDRQDIFADDGTLRPSVIGRRANNECNVDIADDEICLGSDLAANIADIESGWGPSDLLDVAIEAILTLPFGYRPKDDPCGTPDTPGGTYRLVDEDDVVRYVGETNNFARRRGEHLRDPRFVELNFEPKYRTPDRNFRRGLEQQDFNDLWGDVTYQQAQLQGALNERRPMARSNVLIELRLKLAEWYFENCLQ